MNYFEERNDRNIRRAREIVEQLPDFAEEFFIGSSLRTTELTRLNYAYDLRIFFDYLSRIHFKNTIPLKDITLSDLEKLSPLDLEKYTEYLTSYTIGDKKLTCGDRAKERKLCTLRSFFKYYFKKDKLSSNITTKVDLPKIHQKAIVRLEIDEVVHLLDSAENAQGFSNRQKRFHEKTKERDVALLTLMLGTGIRVSECVGLNKEDLDFTRNAFTVTRKGGDTTILYFSEEVRTALKEYVDWQTQQETHQTPFYKNLKDKDALFISLQGTRMGVRAVEKLVKKYAASVTPLKKITPHKLRSTFGTNLYRETQDIYVVADLLGHKDINTTKKHYADMSDEIRRESARKVKLKED